MAGWGDDPELEQLRHLLYEAGWEPVEATVSADPQAADVVVVRSPGGETRRFSSDHIAFHRFVEGLRQDHPDLPG
jgi:hypothetical protein